LADPQLRFWPPPQPLVERLGVAWFRQLPADPGIYRMHDSAGRLLYVGKAKNLRQRLSSYRQTQGQSSRIVRLIHSVDRIDWETCGSEAEALRREGELIRSLQPRFNRAGRWVAPRCWLRWDPGSESEGLRLRRLAEEPAGGTTASGPWPAAMGRAVDSLVRLLWWAAHPDEPVTALPKGFGAVRDEDLPVSLPAGGAWEGWVRGWVFGGDLSVLWELAEVLGGRAGRFESALIRQEWGQVAGLARRSGLGRGWRDGVG
jgi:predicted GIY-YIG superfamily endonuclease